MKRLFLFAALLVAPLLSAADHLVFEPQGEAKGKHVVLLAGDEEYRSEEGMPMLARLLAQHHGFRTTVLFSLDKDGNIDPNNQASLSHPEALAQADAIVMLVRFRHWPEPAMKLFHDAVKRGVPIVALRTSTHAFNVGKDSAFASWAWNHASGGFGRQVLGETWVSHWGKHRAEATRGVVEKEHAAHEVMRGVAKVFGTTDVYEAAPPSDAVVLLRGQVLAGMEPDSPVASYEKAPRGKPEQDVNLPMMPVAWLREVTHDSGKTSRVLCTTMGASTDLLNEDLRRLVVNGVYWGLQLEVPARAEVTPVGQYEPLMYGTKDGTDLTDKHRFRGYRRGVKPDDLQK
jgi:hypothetical protein